MKDGKSKSIDKRLNTMAIDAIDYEIINILQDNADLSAVEISRRLGKEGFNLSGAATLMRCNHLYRYGYLDKPKAKISFDKFGVGNVVFVLLKMNDNVDNKIKALISEISKDSIVFEVYEVFGEYDLIVKLRVRSLSDAMDFSKKCAGKGASTYTIPVAYVCKDTVMLRVPVHHKGTEE